MIKLFHFVLMGLTAVFTGQSFAVINTTDLLAEYRKNKRAFL